MSVKNAKNLVKEARKVAQSAKTWADLSNALFNPVDGIVTSAFPTSEERKSFLKTTEYKEIRSLLSEAMDAHGLVEGATPQKSGRFVVRLPQSLHAALEQEAAREGVSLNQLVVAKLAFQLGSIVGPS